MPASRRCRAGWRRRSARFADDGADCSNEPSTSLGERAPRRSRAAARTADRRAAARDRLRAQHVRGAVAGRRRACPGRAGTTLSPSPMSIRPTSIPGWACNALASRRACCAPVPRFGRGRSIAPLVDARTRVLAPSARSIGNRASAPTSPRWASFCRARGVSVRRRRHSGGGRAAGRRRCVRHRRARGGRAQVAARRRKGAACCLSPTDVLDRVRPVLARLEERHRRGALSAVSFRAAPRRGASFEPGTAQHLPIHALGAAVDLLLEIGAAAIESRVLAPTDRLAEGLRALDARILSPRGPGERSAILTFTHGATRRRCMRR